MLLSSYRKKQEVYHILSFLFRIRPKAKELVDFFHNFTVSVEGLGDVCSFAQMDIRQHGDPNWSFGERIKQGEIHI